MKQPGFTLIFLLTIMMLLSSCIKGDLWKAHTANEKGIVFQDAHAFTESIYEFSKSASYEVYSEIPYFNSANTYFREKKYSKAHDYYQKSIDANVHNEKAWFNDGCLLFEWGKSELDEEFCKIDRTRKLWEEAAASFTNAMEFSKPGRTLYKNAETNRAYIEEQIIRITQFNDKNLEACEKKKQEEEEKKQNQNKQDQREQNESQNNESQDQNQDEQEGDEPEEDQGGGNSQGSDDEQNESSSNQDSKGSLTGEQKKEIEQKIEAIRGRKEQLEYKQSKEQQNRPAEEDSYNHEVWW